MGDAEQTPAQAERERLGIIRPAEPLGRVECAVCGALLPAVLAPIHACGDDLGVERDE